MVPALRASFRVGQLRAFSIRILVVVAVSTAALVVAAPAKADVVQGTWVEKTPGNTTPPGPQCYGCTWTGYGVTFDPQL